MKIMLKLTSNLGPIYIRVEKIAAITPYPQGSPFLTRLWLSGQDDPFCVYEDTGTVLRMLNANDQNESAGPIPALRSGDLAGISETPRANAACAAYESGEGESGPSVPLEFARQLEREIVELKERKAWWIENAKVLTAERNELMNAGENHVEVAARMKQQIADLFSSPNT